MTSTLNRPAATTAAKNRRVGRLRLTVAVVLTLAVALVVVTEFTPVLGVRSVSITGERQVTEAQVRQAAAIRPGTPLVRIDSAAIAARIERLAPVLSVRVRRSLPSSVTITVTERVPVAYQPVAGGFAVLDATDRQLRIQPDQPRTVPRIDAPAATAEAAAAATQAAASVAGALPAYLLRSTAVLVAATPQSVTLTLTDGRVVLWGGTDRSEAKAVLLPVLLHQVGGYFDLSDPDAVISRPKP